MERRLILLRHAKSSWESDAPTDHERPLNSRGKLNAPLVADRLLELEWIPNAVFSSNALRARETWRCMEASFVEADIDVTFTSDLYQAGLEQVLDLAAGWSPAYATVLLLGHNPGWQETLFELTGQEEKLTTCNAALLRGRGRDWSEALSGEWSLEAIIRPKDLEAE